MGSLFPLFLPFKATVPGLTHLAGKQPVAGPACIMAKEFSNPFYHSPAWVKCRESYIKMRGGLCEDCLAKGLIVPGRVVHHIRPLTPENITDPSVTLSFDNLRLVCQNCHAEEHHPTGLRYAFGPDGEVLPVTPL